MVLPDSSDLAMNANAQHTIRQLMERFRTLDLSATASYNSNAFARLGARSVDAHRRVHGPDSARLIRSEQGGDGDSSAHHSWRVRWMSPSHWREELIWPGGMTTVIILGPTSAMSYLSNASERGTLYTSAPPPASTEQERHARAKSYLHRAFLRRGAAERVQSTFDLTQLPTIFERVATFPLLNPNLPESEWQLDTLGEVAHQGRVVRRVRATRRPSVAPPDEARPTGHWPGIDEYECLIDDTLHILMRFTGLVGGVPAGDISVDEVRVNEPLPSTIFSFVPPPGTRIVQLPLSL